MKTAYATIKGFEVMRSIIAEYGCRRRLCTETAPCRTLPLPAGGDADRAIELSSPARGARYG